MKDHVRAPARLRLVSSNPHLDLCSSWSRTAASPFGSDVLSHSMSLTEDCDRPTSPPISPSFMPRARKSLMRDAHVVIDPSLRPPVDRSQRLPVTALRDNLCMPRPPDLPKFSSIGPRVKHWRIRRGFERKEFAKLVGMSYSGLADLENDRSKGGKQLHMIAARLRLNAHYLETDKGEPEADHAQDPPPEPTEWPFQSVPRIKLAKLSNIERSYAETKLLEAIQEIEAERRKRG